MRGQRLWSLRAARAGYPLAVVALVGACWMMSVGAASAATPVYGQVAGSPFATGGNGPRAVAFSADHTLLAAANSSSGTVSVFDVKSDGTLVSAGAPVATGADPDAVAFDGRRLAVANRADNTIKMYTASASGALTPVQTVDAYAPTALSFSGDGNTLAVTSGPISNTVATYTVAADGKLSYKSAAATGTDPVSVAYNHAGTLIAVANAVDNTVSVYTVNASGKLTSAGTTTPTGASPTGVAFSRDGNYLATANYGTGTVSMFSVGSGGALTSDGSTASGDGVGSVAFSPSGSQLAAANSNAGSVSVFSVGSGGSLSAETGSPYSDVGGPVSEAWATDGLFAVANEGSNSVSVFGQFSSTTTTLKSSLNPSMVGQSVTYTATVTAANGKTPTGNVTFDDGSNPISGCSSVSLSGGKATCKVTYNTTAGSPHSITASYNGSGLFQGSTSSAVSQVVNKAATKTVASPATAGLLSVTFSAELTGYNGAPIAGQTIDMIINSGIYLGPNPICAAVTNSAGVATCTAAPALLINLVGATYTASYAGNSDYLPSSGQGSLPIISLTRRH